ncbi:MAG: CDGSH iron-sulfur domain-containing protein [Chlorobiaceae bacterium]|nr:CDGSH iron-sulfur domain-containing protein [Chlorobiaceae bacterium]
MQRENRPCVVTEEPGVKYYCACTKSANWPYCDGSHAGSGISPYQVEIEEARKVAICGCGKSAKMPICDGAHKALH